MYNVYSSSTLTLTQLERSTGIAEVGIQSRSHLNFPLFLLKTAMFTLTLHSNQPVQPTPVYQNDRAEAYWDVPVYAESTVVKSKQVDLRLVDKDKKEVLLMEMTCPWIGNRGEKKQKRPQSMHHLDGK